MKKNFQGEGFIAEERKEERTSGGEGGRGRGREGEGEGDEKVLFAAWNESVKFFYCFISEW
jgi:hypothetical protein